MEYSYNNTWFLNQFWIFNSDKELWKQIPYFSKQKFIQGLPSGEYSQSEGFFLRNSVGAGI